MRTEASNEERDAHSATCLKKQNIQNKIRHMLPKLFSYLLIKLENIAPNPIKPIGKYFQNGKTTLTF